MKTKKVIWKYELRVADEQDVEMPKGAEILSIQTQNGGRPCMWAMVDVFPDSYERIRLKMITTGDSFDFDFDAIRFLGTYQIGGFVGHVFQVY